MNVAWFSSGVSSAIACWLCRNELDEIHYQHIDDQQPDSLRFLHDAEKLIGKPIQIHRSQYGSVDAVCRVFGFLKGHYGCRCTDVLKKRERKAFSASKVEYYNGKIGEEFVIDVLEGRQKLGKPEEAK